MKTARVTWLELEKVPSEGITVGGTTYKRDDIIDLLNPPKDLGLELDVNKDGIISAEELKAIPQQGLRFAKDSDENPANSTYSRDELKAAFNKIAGV